MQTPTRLALLRAQRGLTQEALAKLAGINAATISRLEDGSTPRPRLGTIYRLATALGVPLEDLYEVAS